MAKRRDVGAPPPQDGGGNPERTIGDKLRVMQAGCADDLATFAKAMFDLNTRPQGMMDVGGYLTSAVNIWADLAKGCADRVGKLYRMVGDNS